VSVTVYTGPSAIAVLFMPVAVQRRSHAATYYVQPIFQRHLHDRAGYDWSIYSVLSRVEPLRT
jgi:hypothetical protein